MYSSAWMAGRLAELRSELTMEFGLPREWVFMLFDVCQALELSDAETRAVVGPRYWDVLDGLIDLRWLGVDDG